MLFRHPRTHMGGGCHPPRRFAPEHARASRQKPNESLGLDESNDVSFPPPPRLRLNPPRSGQSKNVAVFGGIGVYSLSCFDMLRLQLNFGGGEWGGVGGEGVPMFGGRGLRGLQRR